MSTSTGTHDVGIVGAGVHGAAAAYHLARSGISTIVFDRGGVAGGPTGLSSGIVRSYYTNPFLAEVARDSTAFLADFADRTDGAGSGYRRTGGLYLHGPDEVDAVREVTGTLAGIGITHDVLEPEALASGFPQVSADGVGIAVWEEEAGYADPRDTAAGLLAAAARAGAALQLGQEIIGIEDRPASASVVLADGSRHEIGRLLVAAGPWTGRLLQRIGVDLPLTAERHIVAGLRHPESSTAQWFPHVLIDLAAGYYSRPLGDTEYLLGGLEPTPSVDPDADLPAVTDEEFALLADSAADRVPGRGAARRSAAWAALYDVSPDWQPVIGRVAENVFVDAGTSGHGFKLAPVLGGHVARLLTDDADPRLAAFDPVRFATGSALSSGFGTARILG